MLKELKCAARPRSVRLSFCQRPLTRLLSLHLRSSLIRSLYNNAIGVKGASALAAILKETQITKLGCAAPRVFAFVSMPIDTHSMPLPLAVSMVTRFRSTSSRA